MGDRRAELDPKLGDEVVAELGVTDIAPDDAGVAALYDAWCGRVPFDNIRKLIGLREGARPLPGDEPDDFFSAWLEHGTGGTCWSSAGALTSLATHLGFRATRLAGAMLDLPEKNHGSTMIETDTATWLLDSSMLHGEPHRLDVAESRTERHGYRSRLVPDGETWMMYTDAPGPGELPCRLHRQARSVEEFRERHERTREWSIFNSTPYVLRHVDGTVQSLNDRKLTVWAGGACTTRELGADARRAWLVDTARFSPTIVEHALADPT